MASKRGPEAQTQALIMDWLAAKGILAFRMNSGSMLSTHKGKTRRVNFGVKGMADVLAFPRGWIHTADTCPLPTWIECKAPDGKQSPLQKSFQEQVEAHGHRYIVAKSLDDVIAALQ